MEALLEASVRLALPLLLAALGELLVEKAGVINIGTEGTMLTGAFAGFAIAVVTGSAPVGAVGGAAAGAAVGVLFAWFAVARRADQIVVGTAVNLLALGATGLLARALYGGAIPTGPTLGALPIPGLAAVPVVGRALFAQSALVYAALLLAPAIAYGLQRTRPGLRLRAVGESARAADAQGVPVLRTRVIAVVAGGALAGLAGAALSLVQSNTFTEGMTAGRGFIALTIVIFGRWKPFGVVAAALFFGAATAMQHRLQARGTDLPYQLTLMLPYVLTLLVLAVAAGRSRAPADLGRAYARESR
jgi:simple sugar transport system permease protein